MLLHNLLRPVFILISIALSVSIQTILISGPFVVNGLILTGIKKHGSGDRSPGDAFGDSLGESPVVEGISDAWTAASDGLNSVAQVGFFFCCFLRKFFLFFCFLWLSSGEGSFLVLFAR